MIIDARLPVARWVWKIVSFSGGPLAPEQKKILSPFQTMPPGSRKKNSVEYPWAEKDSPLRKHVLVAEKKNSAEQPHAEKDSPFRGRPWAGREKKFCVPALLRKG